MRRPGFAFRTGQLGIERRLAPGPSDPICRSRSRSSRGACCGLLPPPHLLDRARPPGYRPSAWRSRESNPRRCRVNAVLIRCGRGRGLRGCGCGRRRGMRACPGYSSNSEEQRNSGAPADHDRNLQDGKKAAKGIRAYPTRATTPPTARRHRRSVGECATTRRRAPRAVVPRFD